MNTLRITLAAALTAAALLAPLAGWADPVTVPIRPAPALADAGPWLNGPPTTLAAQKGRVVVLLFWTRDCINCKHNLGYWNDWARKYQGTDVAVLSVHTPETRFERAPAATARFARDHGLRFPILVDNDAHVWNAYGIQSWPTEVLIDKSGKVSRGVRRGAELGQRRIQNRRTGNRGPARGKADRSQVGPGGHGRRGFFACASRQAP